MDNLKICLCLLMFGTLIIHINSNECKSLLGRLADRQMHYLSCSTDHAVPVTLCNSCEEQFSELVLTYEQLKRNCSSVYFNKDRINVVETTQNMLLDLWNKAYCDDCFSSNNSAVFTDKNTNLTNCLRDHPKQECIACVNFYLDLNDFYKALDEHNNGGICFDIQDAMNDTRINWSQNLKCCQREFHMKFFLITTTFVAVLPILFYVAAYSLTKYRERQAENFLTNEDPPEQVRQPIRVQESTISRSHQPRSTSFEKLTKQFEEIDSESDDDNFYTPKMQKVIDVLNKL